VAATSESIFELVAESSAFSLVSLFVPLAAGIYWKQANQYGCILSMIAGLITWLACVTWKTEYPPILYGLLASGIGMTTGIYFRELFRKTI
jgi:SSS family solute:Na+ symporter